MPYNSSSRSGGGRRSGGWGGSGGRNNNNNTQSNPSSKVRVQATHVAKNKLYTSSGEHIRNYSAYSAAGGRAHSSSGARIHNPTAYQNAIEASVRQNTNDPKYLYHYTDSKSARDIESSGVVKASSRGAMGKGTYLTAKPPRCSSNRLLENNYGGIHASKQSKVDAYVRVDADRVQAQNGRNNLGRDVWKTNGNIYLDKTGAFAGQRKWVC